MNTKIFFAFLLLITVCTLPAISRAQGAMASSFSAANGPAAANTSSTDEFLSPDGTTVTKGAPLQSAEQNPDPTTLQNVDTEEANAPLSSDSLYEFEASLGVGFGYDDNIHDDNEARIAAFATHIRPSFTFRRTGGRITADITYSGDYTFYLGEKANPEYQHNLAASVTAEVVQNLFFINISENMQQVYEDVTRGEFQEGDDTDDARHRNTITIAPYITLHPSERTNLTLGYTFTDTRYSAGSNEETPSFLSLNGEQYNFIHDVSQSHTVHARMDHTLSERASIYVGGNASRVVYDNTESTNITRYTFYVGGSYAFSENLSANFEVGPNYSAPDTGSAALSPYVKANINYSIGRSIFSLGYNTSFEDDPENSTSVHKSSYSLKWSKEFERAKLALGISYNTYRSETNQDGAQEALGNTISPTLSFSYDLTPRLSTFIKYSATLYEDHSLGEHVHTGSYGLNYELSEHLTMALSHRIEHTIPYDEAAYTNNQVWLDFTYKF